MNDKSHGYVAAQKDKIRTKPNGRRSLLNNNFENTEKYVITDENGQNVSKTLLLAKKGKKTAFVIIIICAAILLIADVYVIYINTPAQVISRCYSQAERFLAEQDYSSAIIKLQKVLELDNKNVQAYLDISQAYLEMNIEDSAVRALQAGYETTENSEIKTKLDELLKKQALDLGNIYLSEMKYQQAIDEFQKAVDIDKQCIEAYKGVSDGYIALNQTDKAENFLQQGIDETDNEQLKSILTELKISIYLDNANKLYSQKDYESAKSEYKNVIILDDENAEAYLGMAKSLLALNDKNNAIDILTVGLEKTNDSEIEQTLIGIQLSSFLETAGEYLEDEEYEKAQIEYLKALNTDDRCVEAYLGYADICVCLEQIEQAVEKLQTGFDKTADEQIGTKLNEYKLLQCLNNADNYLYREEYDNAKAEYERALELDEQCSQAYVGLADYYGRIGQQDEAVIILEKGYEITKNQELEDKLNRLNKSISLWQASSYYNNGYYSDAIDEYNKVLAIDPYSVDAYLGIGNSYVKLGNNDAAINILQTGYNYTWDGTIYSTLIYLKKIPHLNLANQYLSSKNYSAAAEEFRTVLGIDYYCEEAYLGLADVYIGLGKLSWADETLVDGYKATGSSKIEVKMFEERLNYVSLSPQKTSYEPLDTLVQQILSQITTSDMSTYQKVKACYDYLIVNCKYGQAPNSYYDTGDMANEKVYAQKSAYAILKGNVGICINYSAAFAAMTRALGLKTQLRSGQTTAQSGGYTSHTWCEINMNGTVYVFDPQVEDNIAWSGVIYYERFCRTYDEVSYHYIPEEYYYMF